jgi:hypothetical protein
VHIFHALRGGREGLFAERLAARNHEEHIVGQQAQHGRGIAGLAGAHPFLDGVANRALVLGHEFLVVL